MVTRPASVGCITTLSERFPIFPCAPTRLFNLDRTRGSCAAAAAPPTYGRGHRAGAISARTAERNALEVLLTKDREARSALDIQPRRPLSIDSDDPRLKAALIIMERNMENRCRSPSTPPPSACPRRQLERLFQDKAQSSPALVYKRMRLEKAKQLLLQTKAPLIDIATQVGYDNASHFARLFREAFRRASDQIPARRRRTSPRWARLTTVGVLS